MVDLHIVKIGGNVIDNPSQLADFLRDFSRLAGPKILVHGGGKAATRMSERLGLAPKMVEGRRITDQEALEVVTMVYGGLANKNVVAGLQAHGCNAIGLTGADGNTIPARKRRHPTIDFGYVGDIALGAVEGDRIKYLLDGGFVPVFCALTHDGRGQLLNTNADTIAATLAVAMAGTGGTAQVSLTYCFEKPGVLRDATDDGSVIAHIDQVGYERLKAEKVIYDGMVPKLDNAFHALAHGVRQVRVTHAANLLDKAGTMLAL